MTTATRARKAPAKKAAPRKRAAKPVTDKEIREWAIANNVEGVQLRGRVSRHIIDRYHEAHGRTAPVQATGATKPTQAPAMTQPRGVGSVLAMPEQDNGRSAVYLVHGIDDVMTIVKPDAVYVETIKLDGGSVEATVDGLKRVLGMPQSAQRNVIVRDLTRHLVALVDA